MKRTTHRIATGIIAASTASALLLTIAPTASASDTPSQAEQAARLVEGVTGTEDLARTAMRGGALAAAETDLGGATAFAQAPKHAAGKVELTAHDGSSAGLGLPQTRDVEGSLAGAGTAVYLNAATSTDLAVQFTNDGGVRAITTLRDSRASTEQRYELNLPSGTEIVPNQGGGYDFVRDDSSGEPSVVIGTVDAPWAKDANGKDVPTSYKLDGLTLIQSVGINKDTAFPVVADPKVTMGKFTYVKFSKKEVKKYARGVKYSPGGASICGVLAVPLAAVACGAIAGARLQHFAGVWASAAKYGKCVEVKFTYWPIVSYFGAKNYKC